MSHIRLSTAIMTHPARLPDALALRDKLPELDARIVVDPAPHEGPNAMRTARLAWQAMPPWATHYLLLQDDALPCEDFPAHLLRAIAARPADAISVYAEWGCDTSYSVRLAALAGSAWAEVVDDYVPTVGAVLPAPLAADFGRFTAYSGPHDDVALRRFLAVAGVRAFVTVPNLAGDCVLPSVVGHGFRGADRSVCWSPVIGTVDHVDWDSEPPAPSALPSFAWQTGHTGWSVPPDKPGATWGDAVAEAVLRDFGLHRANVASLARATIRTWPAICDLADTALFGLWLTGFGLGVVLADLSADPVDVCLARPPARLGMATLPGGALRFMVDRERIAKSAAELTRLAENGVRRGHRARRNVLALQRVPAG